MAYESPAAGVLAIVAAVGETLRVGAVIATIGDGAVPERARVAEPEPDGNGGDPGRVRATPLARRLAREHGVDLSMIEGTGPGGRITRSDVESKARVVQTPLPVEQPPPAQHDGHTQELTRLQQVVARRMSEAKATIPHFQVQTEARIDALLAVRAELKALGEQAAPVPSVNDFIVKACALALRAHPRANGSYRDGRFELHETINIGIAVAASDALVVPTVTDADRRPVREIATESRRLAERVRDNTITPPELSDATVTVSNHGVYGMTAIAPVINPPQAAILGSAPHGRCRRSMAAG
jgi:pyruvate dehydrogenase E2 component (dihydrolipoamide acetyltransferase)